MQSLTLADLLSLLQALDEPENHLKKLFEWQIERVLTVLRLAAAGMAAVLVALIAALLRDDLKLDDWRALIIGLGAIFTGVLVANQYGRVQALEKEYVAALGLLRELAPLVPLLRLYAVPHGV